MPRVSWEHESPDETTRGEKIMSQDNPFAISLKGAPPELLLEIACKTMSAFNTLSDIREEIHQLRKLMEKILQRLEGEEDLPKIPNTITGTLVATCPECKEQTLKLVGTIKRGANEEEIWKCYNKVCHYKGAKE